MTFAQNLADSVQNLPGGVSAGAFTMRNKIINGAMQIDQKNNGSSISATGFIVDRFSTTQQTSATFTAQQSSTAPSGFSNSLLFTVGTGATATSTQYSIIAQVIEGLNCVDLSFGSASAKTVTLSFWVRSSIAGIYCASIRNNVGNRAYIKEYTISSANTWEYKTLTFPGDTSGTWLTTNGAGVRVNFDLGSGSGTPTGAADSWITTNATRTTNQTNFIGTSSATFYITGVQLERGTVATPFEYRNYQQELAMCQRYFITTRLGNQNGAVYITNVAISTSRILAGFQFPVVMRTDPTVTIYSCNADTPGAVTAYNATSVAVGSTFAPALSYAQGIFTYIGGSASLTAGNFYSYAYTASAEL